MINNIKKRFNKKVIFIIIKTLIICNIMISIFSSINIYNIIINNKYNENFINIKSIQQEIKCYNKFNISFKKNKKFFKITNPKISLIITVYNQKNFLIKIYSCIKHQSLTDIEIIFIDDASRDNSSSLIKELMMIDKRIVLIQNSLNKGQFYSRNKAVYNAKGEYILIIDPDDLLLNNILIKLYKISKLYNLDILQFYHMVGNYQNNSIFQMNLSVNEILYPPKIKNLFFNCSDRYLWDKLIKRAIYIKSIEFMVEKYRKERFFIHNDEVTCFGLFKVANSYWLLKEVGYFYNRYNYNSTTKQIYKKRYVNR